MFFCSVGTGVSDTLSMDQGFVDCFGMVRSVVCVGIGIGSVVSGMSLYLVC